MYRVILILDDKIDWDIVDLPGNTKRIERFYHRLKNFSGIKEIKVEKDDKQIIMRD